MAINRRDWLKHTSFGVLAAPFMKGRVSPSTTASVAKPKIKIGQIGTKHGHASSKIRELIPTAARCVAAGKHIHLYKPAGESLPAFRHVLEQAKRHDLTVQMGYMFRYFPAFVFLFDALREGWLGRVFEVHGVIGKKISREARLDLSTYRGGTMFVEGCHLIDLLVIALGEPDNIEAYARRTRPELDAAVDNQLAVFEYPKATATIRSVVVEADDGRHRRRQFVVCGDEGTIEIRPLQPSRLLLTLERPRGSYEKCSQLEVSLPALEGPYDGQLADFARMVRGEKEADLLPSHDLAVHECVLRASGLPLD
jgi:predicted dehydrogenase